MPSIDDDDLDPDLEIPEITDFAGWEVGRFARKPGEGIDIRIRGAIEYSVRLIPSNKVVGRFASTHAAWPTVLAQYERGIPPRLVCLDWHDASGRRGRVSSGRVLEHIARHGIGWLEAEAARKPAGVAG